MEGTPISHYRVEWDVRADFNSTGTEDSSTTAGTDMSTAGFYDVRAIANDDTVLSCDTSCAFAVGAEVQTLDVYSGDSNALTGGEYLLSFTSGEPDNEVTETSACIAHDATAGELETAVGSITGSSVLVARETITDPGLGYRYWITFVGAAVIGDVQALEVTDNTCAGWRVVDAVTVTTQHHVSVETQVNSIVLEAICLWTKERLSFAL